MELLFNDSEKAVEEARVGRRKWGGCVLGTLRLRCPLDPHVEAVSRRLSMSVRFREAQSRYTHLEIVRV